MDKPCHKVPSLDWQLCW